MTISSLLVAVCMGTLVTADNSPPPVGETDVEQARNLFAVGSTAYTEGRYLVAAKAFEAADNLAPRAALVFSVGQSYRLQWTLDRQLVNLDKALAAYRQYLERAPSGRRRGDAVQHLALLEVERQHHRQSVATKESDQDRTELVVSASVPGAVVRVDGSDPKKLPLALEVSPGEHEVRVDAEGYTPFLVTLYAVEGRVTPLMARPEPLPATLQVLGPRGAEVYVDGQLFGRLPLAAPVSVSAGEPTIYLRKRGYKPMIRKVLLNKGERRTVTAKLRPTGQRRVAYGMFIGGITTAVMTGGLAAGVLVTYRGATRITNRTNRRAILPDELRAYNERRSLRNDLLVMTGISAGLTVLLGGTGAILYVTDNLKSASSEGIGFSSIEGQPAVHWTVQF
ncbi:MAG: PEGA domain-containing protein [Myxococcales bacterium]|nr:PEGA domain-containing protein [Myxococcales bacterium]